MLKKGTYVRTLAVDIGKKLGYPAHMSHLIRTGSGDFTLDECITLDELRDMSEEGTIGEHLCTDRARAQSFAEMGDK